MSAGFTERVRQELARTPVGGAGEQRAELAALLRLAGSIHLAGPRDAADRLAIEVETTSGAVARRAFELLQARYGLRAELRVRAAGGVRRRTTYGVAVRSSASDVATDVALLDADGRPRRDLDPALVGTPATVAAYLRGAFLAAGSISAPGRPAHLEVAVTSDAVAARLAALASDLVGAHVGVSTGDRGHRVVSKSGETIGALLTAMGATRAFLEWDEHRLRRSLRSEANRLANADAANLRRTIDAAAAQTLAVERAIERVGWDGLDDDLRGLALARLANPTASLAELGALCDPPLGKSTVHRRLQRLEALARAPDRGD